MPRFNGKSPAESHTTMTEIVLPNHANVHGNILGGRVMHLIDLAGAIAASRHCRQPVVTASVDSLIFLHPIRVGAMILLEATVNRSFRTSMEVEVEVYTEDLRSGERTRTSTAFVTFVALDEKGRPSVVPPVKPATPDEKRRFRAALKRRESRLRLKRTTPSKRKQTKKQ